MTLTSAARAHRIARFQQAVQKEFTRLKGAASVDESRARGISLGDGWGHLVAVCNAHAEDRRLVQTLAKWRDENSFAFPTRFPVTQEGTARWVRSQILDVPDRILFLIVDPDGQAVGHIGFANALDSSLEMEVENVVRGKKGVCPGIMGRAMSSLLGWADALFHPDGYFLKVLSENAHAIRFYGRMGFCRDRLIPLRRHEEGDRIAYLPLANGDRDKPDKQFLRMVYSPNAVSA